MGEASPSSTPRPCRGTSQEFQDLRDRLTAAINDSTECATSSGPDSAQRHSAGETFGAFGEGLDLRGLDEPLEKLPYERREPERLPPPTHADSQRRRHPRPLL